MLLVRLNFNLVTFPYGSLVSCFNAFSRVDVRVEVKIPGGVEAYAIDLRNERRAIPFTYLVSGSILTQVLSDMK